MRLRESIRRVKAMPPIRSSGARRPAPSDVALITADQQRLRDSAAATRAAFVAKRDELVAARETLVARRQSLVHMHGETVAGLAEIAAEIMSPPGTATTQQRNPGKGASP